LKFRVIIAPVANMRVRSLVFLAFIFSVASPLFLGAQESTSDSAAISLPDGLKLQLPPGWKTTVLETGASSSTVPPTAVSLLLHARPEEAERMASLVIVRGDSEGGGADVVSAKQRNQSRLIEIAAESGFKVERAVNKGRADSPNNIILSEVDGIAGDGRRRIFTCVEINRVQRPPIRCYWQYDENDSSGRRQLEDLLSEMQCDGVTVADVIWNGTPMASASLPPGTTQPATASSASVVAGTSLATLTVPSPEVGELVSKYRDSLVVIEGEKGRGSGFVCKMDDKPWLMTNIHVMADNPNPRFATMNGKMLNLGPSFLGVDHDIFRGSVPEGTEMLEAMKDLDVNAKIGDAIAVLGNPEGAGVIKPIEGHIVGIGPNLVEVDAPFVPGNSGSPIVHVASGKVIGIATYLIIRKVDTKGKDGVETTIRRFGYRIDNVAQWQPVNWPYFYAQSAQAAKIEATGEEFAQLFKDLREDKMLSTNYENTGIQRALQNLESAKRANSRMSQADLASVRRQWLSDLRAAAVGDINAFDNRTAYDYFRREVAEEKRFRDDIYNEITRVMDAER
jgi:Trypsin-like peptidase domain